MLLDEIPQYLKSSPNAELPAIEHGAGVVEDQVWFEASSLPSTHITIYRREQKSGPQILIASKQIYANHYFDSSLSRDSLPEYSGCELRIFIPMRIVRAPMHWEALSVA